VIPTIPSHNNHISNKKRTSFQVIYTELVKQLLLIFQEQPQIPKRAPREVVSLFLIPQIVIAPNSQDRPVWNSFPYCPQKTLEMIHAGRTEIPCQKQDIKRFSRQFGKYGFVDSPRTL
jgi:hypothetical protein